MGFLGLIGGGWVLFYRFLFMVGLCVDELISMIGFSLAAGEKSIFCRERNSNICSSLVDTKL